MSMSTCIWLRSESKPLERRTPLTPEDAGRLRAAGYRLVVERSPMRCFDDVAYADVGCELADEHSWADDAPDDAFILGLKELPANDEPLKHRHIYFAHAYKEQAGWRELLRRKIAGGGVLYDLEFLVDDSGRRVAAFGYWAGFAGAAVAVMSWCAQHLAPERPLAALTDYPDKSTLLDELRESLGRAGAVTGGRLPRVIIIGARGRTGGGAADLAAALDLETTGWDVDETRAGGPFPEILDHDIFVNCVLIFSAVPPFITRDLLARDERLLRVIVDVSCDPYGDYNPLPIYDRCTTFAEPALRLVDSPALDLIAIDHLPSMLPVESSRDYSSQLVGSLVQLDDDADGVWKRARQLFDEKVASLGAS